MSITDAARGSSRELLEALRDHIASELDEGVPARELAALSKRLMDIRKEIEALDAEEEGDDIGDAAATPDEPWEG